MTPEQALQEKLYLGPRRAVVSVSGGKDSTATCLLLRELGIPYDAIFMDTGWELPETYDYIRDVLPGIVGPIRWLRADIPLPPDLEAIAQDFEQRLGVPGGGAPPYSAMVRAILQKSMFSARVRRFCTQVLKTWPSAAYLRGHPDEPVSVVGIRAEESEARAKMSRWEWMDEYDCEVWRPLLDFTLEDVISIHRRHGVAPNHLYIRGASRVGCAPCIFASKLEIRMLHSIAPDRFEVIRDLEKVVAQLARARAEAKGEPLVNPPTWFQNPTSRSKPTGRWVCAGCGAIMEVEQAQVTRGRYGRDDHPVDVPGLHGSGCPWGPGSEAQGLHWRKERKHAGDCWPIDRVVRWSYTRHGGRIFEPFAATPEDGGCMRWGLCDLGWRAASISQLPGDAA